MSNELNPSEAIASSSQVEMSFGHRLLEARTERKLAQTAVAAACGVSQATYSRWESTDAPIPGADKAFQLARFLEVRVQWLVEGIGPVVGSVDDVLVTTLRTPALRVLHQLNAAFLAEVEAVLPADLLDLLAPPTPDTREHFESKLRAALGALRRDSAPTV